MLCKYLNKTVIKNKGFKLKFKKKECSDFSLFQQFRTETI